MRGASMGRAVMSVLWLWRGRRVFGAGRRLLAGGSVAGSSVFAPEKEVCAWRKNSDVKKRGKRKATNDETEGRSPYAAFEPSLPPP